MAETISKIQIVAFTTTPNNDIPYQLIKSFLSKYPHQILKEGNSLLTFNVTLSETNARLKVLFYLIINLNKEYAGINDSLCNIIFIDSENEESKQKYQDLLTYIKEYCEESKKTFIVSFRKTKSEENVLIKKKQISSSIDNLKRIYEYNEIVLEETDKIAECLSNIMIYCKRIFEGETASQIKDDDQAK
jgi:hypothetical protein